MDNNMEKCPEGGEGYLVEQSFFLPQNVIRCTCIACKAQDCKRLKAYLEDSKKPDNKFQSAEFCGEVLKDPRKDCNYFL
jgi:hypothetical protein